MRLAALLLPKKPILQSQQSILCYFNESGTSVCTILIHDAGLFLLEICELKYCFSVGIVNSVHDVIVVEVRPRQKSDLSCSFKVHGSHFSNWTTFKVQTAQLTCYVLNVSLASCLIPHKFHFQPVNKLFVSSDNGLTWSSSWAKFEFVVAAAVHRNEPSVVVEGQVTSVTVVGNGFSAGSGVVCASALCIIFAHNRFLIFQTQKANPVPQTSNPKPQTPNPKPQTSAQLRHHDPRLPPRVRRRRLLCPACSL